MAGAGVSFRLDGQVAMVVGATGGLGEAAAFALAEAGADVAVVDLDRQRVDELASALGARGSRSVGLGVDICERAKVDAAVLEVTRSLGTVGVLVNCAGVVVPGSAVELPQSAWEDTFAVNVIGAANCCRAVAAQMIEAGKGGRVINFASTFSEVGWPGRAAYAASKGAVRQMTRVMALEWAEYGITVNAVSPTAIRTPMTDATLADPAARQRLIDHIPLGRIGEPDDVAGAVVFLASSAARFITGINLLVDGGWTAV